MRRLFQWPASTLTRRVTLALLMAIGLVGLVLLAQSYVEFRQDFKPGADSALVKAVRVVASSLQPLRDRHEAEVVLQTIQRQSDLARKQNRLEGQLLIELIEASGHRVYATPALALTPLQDAAHAQIVQRIGQRDYRVAQAQAGAWTLRFAEPRLGDGAALWLFLTDLGPSLLIALPLVWLPTWLAVRQGLKPLRLLTRHLNERPADDLSPLAVDLRHAELQSVGRAFDQLLDKLRQQVSRERAFVQDAAHEMRTPLAVISAQVHVLARVVDQVEREQAEGVMLEAIRRASHMAQQLLALASLDAGRAVAVQQLDLAACLQALLAQAQPLAAQRGIDLSLDAPDSWDIDIDRPAFESIALNLIDNAIRYGVAGGQVAVRLEVSVAWRLTVADDGPGIPVDQRARMFERFARGPALDQAGTGLGLAIVAQAAQRLGATVSVAEGLAGRGVGVVVERA